jgi:hypothetical protein
MEPITDIWFKTELDLEDLVVRLGLNLEEYDSENVWEWAVSAHGDIKLDICRDHTRERSETVTKIFRIDVQKGSLPEVLVDYLISRLKGLGISPISLGSCVIGANDRFKFKVAKVID